MLNKETFSNFANATARRSFPKDPSSGISITVKPNGTTAYIPPADGFATISSNGTGITAEIRQGSNSTLSTNPGNTWGKTTLMVKKGVAVYFGLWGNPTATYAYFIPSGIS